MRALAAWAMRGPYYAAALTAGLGLASWAIPLPHFSAAVLGLVALARGPRQAAWVGALAALPVLGGSLGLFGSFAPAVALSLWWLVCAVFCVVLRARADQGLALGLVAAGALMLTGALRALPGDAAQLWLPVLRALSEVLGASGEPALAPGALEQTAVLLTSILGATLVVNVMLTVLLARWWQSLLYNPGGFRREFHRLALPRSARGGLALVGTLAAVAALIAPGEVGLPFDVLLVGLMMLMFVGLAVAHHEVARRGWSVGVLVGLYVLLALLQGPAVVLLALLALADAWLDLRGLRGDGAGGGQGPAGRTPWT